jgi:hypothetical protein
MNAICWPIGRRVCAEVGPIAKSQRIFDNVFLSSKNFEKKLHVGSGNDYICTKFET